MEERIQVSATPFKETVSAKFNHITRRHTLTVCRKLSVTRCSRQSEA